MEQAERIGCLLIIWLVLQLGSTLTHTMCTHCNLMIRARAPKYKLETLNRSPQNLLQHRNDDTGLKMLPRFVGAVCGVTMVG